MTQIENFINNLVGHYAINNIINSFAWFSTLHITGVGFIVIALLLLVAGKKIFSGFINIVVIVLFLIGIASIFGLNLFTFL